MPRPNRLPGWQNRLQQLVGLQAQRRFAYGEWDCALFVAAAVEAVTGRDVRPPWTYANRAEGVRKMRQAGHADHIAYFRSLFPTVDAGQARPGDIALMPGHALGIVQGRAVYQLSAAGMSVAPLQLMLEGLAV